MMVAVSVMVVAMAVNVIAKPSGMATAKPSGTAPGTASGLLIASKIKFF